MPVQMTQSERETFLADLHVGVLGIQRQNRGPLTVPIWYDYIPGGVVWMITNQESIKGRLLKDVARISLCAQSEQPPYKYVSVEGTFAISPATDAKLLHMAVRYLGEEQGKGYAAQGSGDGGIVVSITPESWLTVDYAKS